MLNGYFCLQQTRLCSYLFIFYHFYCHRELNCMKGSFKSPQICSLQAAASFFKNSFYPLPSSSWAESAILLVVDLTLGPSQGHFFSRCMVMFFTASMVSVQVGLMSTSGSKNPKCPVSRSSKANV